MLSKIILLVLISQCFGFKQTRSSYGHHENHGHEHHDDDHHNEPDHDEDDCVDVSKYSEVEYESTTDKICG